VLAGLLAPGHDLAAEANAGPRLFEAEDSQGVARVYTVTPLVPDVAYALGIWTPEQARQGIGKLTDSPLLFPLLMWIVSLVVAFWSLHGLMIRRVTELASRMRRFGRDRSLLGRISGPGAPYELREIEDAFRTMAASILQDEARMENAFRERGVLLREVHHRVKNNLQLISSIISMQVRRMPDPRTRSILRRLQDRVLTLASIYRSLYTSPDLGDVNAAPVVRAIVEQELRNAQSPVEATLDIEDMVLDPDKVVPLAFLAAEAMSNAVSRARSPDGRPSISATLHRDGDTATLRIANSLDAASSQEDAPQGLGQHLIQAFAAQVGGPVETQLRDRLFILSVTFPTATHHAETEDA
ncbi:MAG TPA: sensor histidine kinase, partial [Rubellimicrobium sp.]|nr:sensor histidine kinase [Rubellimicrobium sp.]